MSKHTQGPWTNIGTAVYFPAVKGGFDFYGCPDAEGNAKLCAAAPDLLEAAEMAIAWYAQHEFDTTGERGEYNVFDEDPEFVTFSRAAIAKAKGESL